MPRPETSRHALDSGGRSRGIESFTIRTSVGCHVFRPVPSLSAVSGPLCSLRRRPRSLLSADLTASILRDRYRHGLDLNSSTVLVSSRPVVTHQTVDSAGFGQSVSPLEGTRSVIGRRCFFSVLKLPRPTAPSLGAAISSRSRGRIVRAVHWPSRARPARRRRPSHLLRCRLATRACIAPSPPLDAARVARRGTRGRSLPRCGTTSAASHGIEFRVGGSRTHSRNWSFLDLYTRGVDPHRASQRPTGLIGSVVQTARARTGRKVLEAGNSHGRFDPVTSRTLR